MYDRLTELLLLEGEKQHKAARKAARRDHDEKMDPEKGWTRYSSQWGKNTPPAAKLKSYRKTYEKERARLKSQPIKPSAILPRPELPPGPEPKKPERPPIDVTPPKPAPAPAPAPRPAPSPTTPDPEEPDVNPNGQEDKKKKKKSKEVGFGLTRKLVDLVRQSASTAGSRDVF